jgi:hypothetical protein
LCDPPCRWTEIIGLQSESARKGGRQDSRTGSPAQPRRPAASSTDSTIMGPPPIARQCGSCHARPTETGQPLARRTQQLLLRAATWPKPRRISALPHVLTCRSGRSVDRSVLGGFDAELVIERPILWPDTRESEGRRVSRRCTRSRRWCSTSPYRLGASRTWAERRRGALATDEDEASAGAQSAPTALLHPWKAAVTLPLSRSMRGGHGWRPLLPLVQLSVRQEVGGADCVADPT